MNGVSNDGDCGSHARRRFLGATAVLAACGLLGAKTFAGLPADTRAFAVNHTDDEWKSLLTPQQYSVLRQQGTERPFSSPLDHEKRSGTFTCAGCANPLFGSATKFDSGTGWPSFWKPLANAVDENNDRTLGMLRTEVNCRRCGGHLGHVFDDGPAPTGLRYCMNGVAMTFTPAA